MDGETTPAKQQALQSHVSLKINQIYSSQNFINLLNLRRFKDDLHGTLTEKLEITIPVRKITA